MFPRPKCCIWSRTPFQRRITIGPWCVSFSLLTILVYFEILIFLLPHPQGWTVVCTCMSLYFFILIVFGFCGGWADGAYPAYRETLYGPNDRVVVRHRKRAEPANKV